MTSPKDKCFAEAIDAYQDFRKESGSPWSVEVTHQTTWVLDVNAPGARWEPIKNKAFAAYNHVVNYVKKSLGYSTPQVRYPDVTVMMQDGSHIVVDNKFTDAQGKIDSWGRRLGSANKKTQRHDYKQINQQQGHNIDDPSLDKEKCNCADRKRKQQLQPRVVPVPDPASQLYFMPYPSQLPGQVPAPGRLPIPRPILVPRPILIP